MVVPAGVGAALAASLAGLVAAALSVAWLGVAAWGLMARLMVGSSTDVD
jgi:hypothetical protein